jgi:microcystin-dependent protein
MTTPFIGEIRMFGGTFAPRGWAFCDGQLIQVQDNEALFSLLGTIYGGDGRTTFALPDLRGRLPIHTGSGPGLTPRTQGSQGGEENVTVTAQQLPSHPHTAPGTSAGADTNVPPGGRLPAVAGSEHYADPSGPLLMNNQAVMNAGGGQSHNNVMPFQCINFIIALTGLFPSRT